MIDLVQIAEKRFEGPYSCSQAILSAFAPACSLEEAQAIRLAAPFGGGMARQGEVCGAVSAALMVIGLARGKADPQDKEDLYRLAGDFMVRFREKHATVLCRELIGYNLSVPAEAQAARESKASSQLCPSFVRSAAVILTELLR